MVKHRRTGIKSPLAGGGALFNIGAVLFTVKILFSSIEPFPPSQGSRGMNQLKVIQRMVERGHEVTLSAPILLGDAQARRLEAERGIRIRNFAPILMAQDASHRTLRCVAYGILYALNLLRLLAFERYDLIYVADSVLAPSTLAVRWLTRSVFVLNVDGIFAAKLYKSGLAPTFLANAIFGLEQSMPRFFDIVFTVTPQFKLLLVGGGCLPSRVHVAYAGIDSELFRPKGVGDQDIGAIKVRYGIEQKLVLFASSLDGDAASKLRDVIGKVTERRSDVTFIVAGQGRRYEELMGQVRSERVRFVGGIGGEAMPAYAAAASAGLVIFEDQPESDLILPAELIQYLGMGLPTASTEQPSLREIFGFHDFIKLSNSAPEMAADILELVDRPKSQEASELVARQFGWEAVARDIVQEMERRIGQTD
jgi:glycosyltransferase involved in cell wall biosynthesis